MIINFYYDPDTNKLHVEWFFSRKTYQKARFIKSAMRRFNYMCSTARAVNAKSGTLVIDKP